MSDSPPPEKDEKARAGRVHPIAIDTLIVHKYSGSDALLRKADKIAREIIGQEIREGEYFRTVKPGRYHLHFPRLLPEAGQLRASIIANRIYRAIRDFNPTAVQIREKEESTLDPPPLTLGIKDESDAPPRPKTAQARAPETEEEAEMRKMATLAMKGMTTDAVSAEELLGSKLGRLLQSDLEIKRVPVWNVKSGLISAYECIPVRRGALALKSEDFLKQFGATPADVKALLDLLVYRMVGAILQRNVEEQKKVLMLCPVHASTLHTVRTASAYIGAGADIPKTAQKYVVFLIKDLKASTTRLKLDELSRYLLSRSRGLVAELPFAAENLAVFKELGFHGVRASAVSGTEQEFLKLANVFAERCEKAKLESFIGDVRTNSAAIGALASGCTYLSGSIIAKRAGGRGAIEEFALDSLFGVPPSSR